MIGGRFDAFYYFLLGGGEGESEAPGRGGARDFLSKIPGGGGGLRAGEAGRGRGRDRHTILFKIIIRIKLLFSNYVGRYSYSFRARQELISVTVTVFGSDGKMSLQLQFGTVTLKNGLRNNFLKITVTVT